MWMILAMGLADLGGYCIPALPKGQNWQMVETKLSNKMRPIVWTNRRQIRVSFPLGSVGDDWNLSHDSSGVPRSPLAASQSSCHWTIPWQIQNRENVENLWILENDIKSTKSQIPNSKWVFFHLHLNQSNIYEVLWMGLNFYDFTGFQPVLIQD